MNHQYALADAIGCRVDVTTSGPTGEPSPPRRRRVGWMVAASIVCGATAAPCAADTSSLGAVIEDTRLYFTAPLRWNERDWLQFATSVGAIGAAHEYDDNVRAHFITDTNAQATGKNTHGLRDAAPMAAMVVGTWAAATAFDDRSGYEEGRIMLEAGALTALSTTLIKFGAGRSRPDETSNQDDWRNGGDSFPSMHVSTAFAVGTVLAESGNSDYRWLRRAIGYGLATATAYARVHSNVHWLSDTVAGAALGIATAQFAMNRSHGAGDRSVKMLTPVQDGVMFTYSVQLK